MKKTFQKKQMICWCCGNPLITTPSSEIRAVMLSEISKYSRAARYSIERKTILRSMDANE